MYHSEANQQAGPLYTLASTLDAGHKEESPGYLHDWPQNQGCSQDSLRFAYSLEHLTELRTVVKDIDQITRRRSTQGEVGEAPEHGASLPSLGTRAS